MAVLNSTERRKVLNHLMRAYARNWAVNKVDFQAAVDATDQWIDDNAASFNSALPLPARTAMSTVDKTIMFCLVAMRRAGILTTADD